MGKPVISAATFYNTGSVDLNDVLAKKHDAGDLKELNVDAVVAYLKDNLSYQVYAAGAETETPGDLSVEVISTEVKPPQTASDFPQWVGGFEKHPEITE